MTSRPDTLGPAAPTLRERRHAETRAQIVEAAVDLALSQGASTTTVEEIAQRAGISPRTFFNHFPAKRDAFLGWAPVVDPAAAAAFSEGPGTLLDDLELLLATLVDSIDRDRLDRFRDMLAANPDLRPHLHQSFRGVEHGLAAAIADRLSADPTSPVVRVLAATSAGVLRVALDAWRGTAPGTPLALVVADHVSVLRDLHRT